MTECVICRKSLTKIQVRKKGRFCGKACQHKGYEGANNWIWKGDGVGYSGLHKWVRRQLGSPKRCEHCHTLRGKLEWANISREYKRETRDWFSLCTKCHRAYDDSLLRGEDALMAKLKEYQVIEILALLNEGNMTQSDIGLLYNVHYSTINKIARGHTWKHLRSLYSAEKRQENRTQ